MGKGEPPLKLDCAEPKIPVADFMRGEGRFRMVEKMDPERYRRLLGLAQRDARQHFAVYQQLAAVKVPREEAAAAAGKGAASQAEEAAGLAVAQVEGKP
jgi:pyruvate-ferredoxin/flavodoxin oxidoreductase